MGPRLMSPHKSAQKSFIGPDLHLRFNYLKRCKLSRSCGHGRSDTENADGVFFTSCRGGQRSETTKRKGLHSGSEITELDKATSSLALAFSNAPRGRELIEPNARKVDI